MAYKLRNKNAATLMASSPLYNTPPSGSGLKAPDRAEYEDQHAYDQAVVKYDRARGYNPDKVEYNPKDPSTYSEAKLTRAHVRPNVRGAVGQMSPLRETPDPLSEVSYSQSSTGDQMESQKYQSKLRERAKANPQGYFTFDDKLYDKKYYKLGGTKRYPAVDLNEGYTMDYEKGLQYNAPKTQDKPKDLSQDPVTQSIKKKEQSMGYGGTVGPKGGSIGNLPKTGNLQVQNWGDMKDITLGHGDKKATGDQKLMKGPYEFVNTGKGKLNVPQPKTTDKKASVDATSLVPKGGFGGGGTGKRIGNTDALNFDPTKFGLNKDGSTKTKSTSTSNKTKPKQKLEIDRIAPRPITNTRPEQVGTGSKNMASKMANVIGNATNANYDIIANKPASGRRQRIQRRLQKRQQNLEGRIANRAERPLIKQDRADAKQLRQETRQKGRETKQMNKDKSSSTNIATTKSASTIKNTSSQPQARLEKQKPIVVSETMNIKGAPIGNKYSGSGLDRSSVVLDQKNRRAKNEVSFGNEVVGAKNMTYSQPSAPTKSNKSNRVMADKGGFDYSKGGKSKRSKKNAQRTQEAQKYGI